MSGQSDVKRPWYEAIVTTIQSLPENNAGVAINGLRAIGTFLQATTIPRNHKAIIDAFLQKTMRFKLHDCTWATDTLAAVEAQKAAAARTTPGTEDPEIARLDNEGGVGAIGSH